MISLDGLMNTDNPNNFKHVASYNAICSEYDKANEEWVDRLIEQGYKAAHPNDGWVDRANNKVTFTYPHFNLKPKEGDKIMLGWHTDSTNRPVIVTKVEYYKGVVYEIIYYHFKDL